MQYLFISEGGSQNMPFGTKILLICMLTLKGRPNHFKTNEQNYNNDLKDLGPIALN